MRFGRLFYKFSNLELYLLQGHYIYIEVKCIVFKLYICGKIKYFIYALCKSVGFIRLECQFMLL